MDKFEGYKKLVKINNVINKLPYDNTEYLITVTKKIYEIPVVETTGGNEKFNIIIVY